MTIIFNSFAFVEQFDGESDADLTAAIESAIQKIYGKRPDWMEYHLGETRYIRGRAYREFKCSAGSVTCQFIMNSTKPEGLGRRLFSFGEEDGQTQVFVYGPEGEEVLSRDEVK